jgi:hypothetical protein
MEPPENRVLISAIKNFLSVTVRNAPDPDKFDEKVTETVTEFMTAVKETAKKLLDTKFALVKPLLQPKHKWCIENFEKICVLFDDEIRKKGLENVSRLDVVSRMLQVFKNDGVHLRKDAGHIFVDRMPWLPRLSLKLRPLTWKKT